ncbi:MAG: hypothetical protein PWR27_2477 [Petroclostridium sp.]|jgi:hypothetical protein|nr:hypothetical protein [Clostridia bacterium]MDK2811768.1 hypothetical protein [Petroclostridium sp.]
MCILLIINICNMPNKVVKYNVYFMECGGINGININSFLKEL